MSSAANRAAMLLLPLMAFGAVALPSLSQDGGNAGPAAVRSYCSGCHLEERPGHFQRLSALRKSPEGWLMTIVRMQQVHRIALPEDARDTILRHFADTQGLAPAESAAGRFALEQRPNSQDLRLADDLPILCGRCHSLARVSLQRRDADEWRKLVHTHVGQYPTLEYQATSRDRDWWDIATGELPGKLGAMFPLDSAEWRQWQERPRRDPAGRWFVRGRVPGRGDYFGTLSVTAAAGGDYVAEYSLRYTDGSPIAPRRSKVRVYTGYEWRGTSTSTADDLREVFALSEDGARLSGRWFEAAHPESGGDLIAERDAGPEAIFAIAPRALKAGQRQEVTISGRGLSGAVSFGRGTRARVLSRDEGLLRVEVVVASNAKPGMRDVRVGRTAGPGLAVVYDRVARLEVAPGYAIARVGGGPVPPVAAQFEAVGYAVDPGRADKAATLELGPMPVTWSVEPNSAEAAAAEDVKFAGTMEPGGRFMPGRAGPNPQRKFSGNNVGDLKVVASLAQGTEPLRGESRLIVTVQKWVSPPIN